MIEELIAWARLDCMPAAQRLGLRREAAALAVRHRRLRAQWADHIAQTRAALLASARLAAAVPAAPRRAWLMGAGLLQDVPLPELLRLFDRVDLVDVCFGPAARAAERMNPDQVRCVRQDVSGVLDDLSRDPQLAAPAMPADAWCASVNMLSQLPLLPCAARLDDGCSEAEVERYGRSIQRAHIDALSRVPHACLIIEYAQTLQQTPAEVLLPGLPERLVAEGWTAGPRWHWPLNPEGETDQPSGRAMQAWSRGGDAGR
ncbi:hypothetical protein [Methyloversatilis discipulorum]|uniref:hypothetical protein n=1 Tax=Methyloversatilis discipulorum TaxID=1119528 RepID=UPI001A499DAB|nr:hypothetical protein [Methyloversatilis discipulorum]MBL8468774.1 hypothetical protein [Methyloversatilis discipulorum]